MPPCSCRTFREEPLARSVSYQAAPLTRQNERCHENASDCLRLDRCGGDAGDTSTCRLLRGLPSRRTMPGVLRSVPAILRSVPAILWSIALLCSAPVILWSTAAILWSARLRLTGTPPRRPSEKARAVIERRRGVWRAPRGLPATPWQRPASHAWQRWQRLYVKALPRSVAVAMVLDTAGRAQTRDFVTPA